MGSLPFLGVPFLGVPGITLDVGSVLRYGSHLLGVLKEGIPRSNMKENSSGHRWRWTKELRLPSTCITLVWPPPCNSHHQDFSILSRGFLLTFTFHCYREGAICNVSPIDWWILIPGSSRYVKFLPGSFLVKRRKFYTLGRSRYIHPQSLTNGTWKWWGFQSRNQTVSVWADEVFGEFSGGVCLLLGKSPKKDLMQLHEDPPVDVFPVGNWWFSMVSS